MDQARIFGENIKWLRLRLDLSQDQVAEQLHGAISQTYLSDVERGIAENITLGKMQILASFYHTTVPALLSANLREADPVSAA